jgi:hypothetical protein
MKDMLKLLDAPFAKFVLPSITVELNSKEMFYGCQLVVSTPEGSWSVSFGPYKILGLRINDESFDVNERFHVERDFDKGSAYIWTDSPWLMNELGTGHIDYLSRLLKADPAHYVFLGSDYNVEVLAVQVPTITRLEKPEK